MCSSDLITEPHETPKAGSAPVPQPTSFIMSTARVAHDQGDGSSLAAALAPATGSAGATIRPTVATAPAVGVGITGGTATELQNQIVQAMRVQWNGGIGDAQIRLQPAYLGDLAISLKVENGAVTAHLAASSAEVRQWIEANESSLRQGLAAHDQIGRAHV